jgi:outer membrane protein TolC
MKMKPVILILIVCFLAIVSTEGQNTYAWPDLRSEILNTHPLVQQADLFRESARSALFRAKGGFDVKTYTDFNSKNFNQKNYFQHTEGGLKLPTWYGLELKTAYTYANGFFLNPEEALPRNGQAVFGFNWTLGQGLFIDERRAGLFEARAGLQMGDAERASLLNDLSFEAAKNYWAWAAADNAVRVISASLAQNRIRHEALRESFKQGERAAIDTVETFIQLQNRQLDLNFSTVERTGLAFTLANYRWDANGNSIAINTGQIGPDLLLTEPLTTFNPETIQAMVQKASVEHPGMQFYSAKLNMLDVERRLKTEKRKPVIDFNYNILGSGWSFFPTATSDGGGVGVLARDIKWGINFSLPIPNRKARGELQITQIKIAQNQLARNTKRQEIEGKIRQYAAEMNTLSAQIDLYRSIVANYRALLDAESDKFTYGESSVFLINTREQRWLDAQLKYLKLVSEYRKAEAGLLWATGGW